MLLRELRTGRGLTVSRLADRAGVNRATVQRLERAQIRARPSTLRWLAVALDPARHAEVHRQLAEAAGTEVGEDSEAWSRRHTRLMARRLAEGRAPLHPAWEQWIRLTAASEAMWHAALGLLDRADSEFRRRDRDGTLIRRLLAAADELQDEARQLGASAGVRVTGTPATRRRGDPADVSPFAPADLGDLRAVLLWVRGWQVREGRREPRSARERAIAATGERERQAVRDAPDPPPPVAAEDRALLEAD